MKTRYILITAVLFVSVVSCFILIGMEEQYMHYVEQEIREGGSIESVNFIELASEKLRSIFRVISRPII